MLVLAKFFWVLLHPLILILLWFHYVDWVTWSWCTLLEYL